MIFVKGLPTVSFKNEAILNGITFSFSIPLLSQKVINSLSPYLLVDFVGI